MKQFIDKYQIQIGIGLIVVALAGGVFLMVKKSNAESSSQNQNNDIVASRDKQISDLQNQIATLQKENQSLKNSVTTADTTGSSSSPNSVATSTPTGKININTATASQLDALPGIGPTYAARIVDYRNQHGAFKSISEIQNVKGIGPKTYDKFKDQITI
ncbi:MAG: helix-hairpin-helix domain-containing protein [Candidatus Berkelbacteria bacterium]|nr:helix-hairpin-helix domain-containing protein [Candidatus Berkelbacteria bacterium]